MRMFTGYTENVLLTSFFAPWGFEKKNYKDKKINKIT